MYYEMCRLYSTGTLGMVISRCPVVSERLAVLIDG